MWDWMDFMKAMAEAQTSRQCRVAGCSEPTQKNEYKRFIVCRADHFDFGTEKPPTVRANG